MVFFVNYSIQLVSKIVTSGLFPYMLGFIMIGFVTMVIYLIKECFSYV